MKGAYTVHPSVEATVLPGRMASAAMLRVLQGLICVRAAFLPVLGSHIFKLLSDAGKLSTFLKHVHPNSHRGG